MNPGWDFLPRMSDLPSSNEDLLSPPIESHPNPLFSNQSLHSVRYLLIQFLNVISIKYSGVSLFFYTHIKFAGVIPNDLLYFDPAGLFNLCSSSYSPIPPLLSSIYCLCLGSVSLRCRCIMEDELISKMAK